MKKRGRPTRLDARLAQRISALLAKGATIKSAAIQCGVSEKSYHNWIERGKASEVPFEEFFLTATRARERWKQRLIETVMEAADRDAKHAEWLLEQQFPHEFAPFERRPIPAEVEAVEGKQVSIQVVLNTGGKSLEEVAAFPALTPEEVAQKAPEPEPTAGELFDGNIGKLGRVVHDLPFDANGG
jgi:hypothetical protein